MDCSIWATKVARSFQTLGIDGVVDPVSVAPSRDKGPARRRTPRCLEMRDWL